MVHVKCFLPTVEKLAKQQFEGFEIVKVNLDSNRELAQQVGVRCIPDLFFVTKGKVQEKLFGVQSESVLETRIKKYSVAV